MVYDHLNSQSFAIKIKDIQYNAVLAIRNASKGTSRAKLYKQLGCESLSFCSYLCWFNKNSNYTKICL